MLRRTRRISAFSLTLFALAACEGPTGPEGPQGEPGEPGPGTRTVLTGTLNSSGAGLVHLSPEAGTLTDPPGVTCYVAETADSDVWLVVATSNATGACAILTDGDHLDAGIVESAPGWAFRIVAVY